LNRITKAYTTRLADDSNTTQRTNPQPAIHRLGRVVKHRPLQQCIYLRCIRSRLNAKRRQWTSHTTYSNASNSIVTVTTPENVTLTTYRDPWAGHQSQRRHGNTTSSPRQGWQPKSKSDALGIIEATATTRRSTDPTPMPIASYTYTTMRWTLLTRIVDASATG